MDWIWPHLSPMSRETRIPLQRPITRSLSAGETLTRSATFHALSSTYDHRDDRRTSIGSSATITHSHTSARTPTHCDANALQHVKSNRPYRVLFSCLLFSIIRAPVRGAEWKLPCEGTVNHQSRPFRVARHTAQSGCNYGICSVYISQLP